MQFRAVTASAAELRSDCAIVGVYESRELTPAAAALDKRAGKRIAALLARGDFAARVGDTLLMSDLDKSPAPRVLLVGLGARKALNRRLLRRAMLAAAQAVTRTGAKHAVSWLAHDLPPDIEAYYAGRFAAETVSAALYRVPDLKSAKHPPTPALARLTLGVADNTSRAAAERGLNHGAGVAAGQKITRDLGNLPPNVCTPRYIARSARELARRNRAIRVRVLEEAALQKLGMGSFLAVARGSHEPPRLVVLEYRGGRKGAAPVALVGKGITFDSGGISLKDPPGMDEMKFDMTGAASVLGAFAAAAALELPINLVGVVPACENMPSGHATKPGDIVKSLSGQTIEVLNTDAEGRLILADALTYVRDFKPSIVIDIATLTGACVVALGAHFCGLMTPDDELAGQLLAASERSDDRAWRMPLTDDYGEQLRSNFADFANTGGREGGAITAAWFLSRFTQGMRWAHLDIAGVAWLGGAQKGSTGRPIGLLVDFLLERARVRTA